MTDIDRDRLSAMRSEEDLEAEPEEVQQHFRPAQPQPETSYAEATAVLDDADDQVV